jgi:hypothetical protein
MRTHCSGGQDLDLNKGLTMYKTGVLLTGRYIRVCCNVIFQILSTWQSCDRLPLYSCATPRSPSSALSLSYFTLYSD